LPSRAQCVTKSAKCVAGCLGVPEAKVRCVVKRLGGGFGGKETLSIYRSGAIAVAAAKLKRGVRLVISREEDMAVSGQSHPFDGSWTAGFDERGKILACDVELVNDAGCTVCCSNVVMDRGLAHFANAYDFGAFRATGRLAWTHKASNTAFRGFGVPQACLIAEDMLEAVAAAVGRSADHIRLVNLVPPGGHTAYGQLVACRTSPQGTPCHTRRIWKELEASSQLARRRAAAERFNAQHRWRKRGIALIPSQYGVNFPVQVSGAQLAACRLPQPPPPRSSTD
jgi:xanthine dehydrogenase/oxidase